MNDNAKKKQELKKYKELDLVYSNKFSFCKNHDINKFKRNLFDTKYDDLDDFLKGLDKFDSLEPQRPRTKEKKFE